MSTAAFQTIHDVTNHQREATVFFHSTEVKTETHEEHFTARQR